MSGVGANVVDVIIALERCRTRLVGKDLVVSVAKVVELDRRVRRRVARKQPRVCGGEAERVGPLVTWQMRGLPRHDGGLLPVAHFWVRIHTVAPEPVPVLSIESVPGPDVEQLNVELGLTIQHRM